MPEDTTLLRRYAEDRDEPAFAELVRRHLDGVYSIALRRVGGDVHLARDVAQSVVIALAREAGRLSGHPVLAGWFHTATRYAAANAVRSEQRRKKREQEAEAMNDAWSKGPPDVDWNQLAPVLDHAIDELGETDRVAVLLRFVDRRTFGEIGAALRLTEDAARRRVERALEKLRGALGRRGVVSTASALTGTLTARAVHAAPTGLATSVTGAALTSAPVGGGALTLLSLMSTTKIQLGLAGAVLLAAGIGFMVQPQSPLRRHADVATVHRPAVAATSTAGTPTRTAAPFPSPAAAASTNVPLKPAAEWQNRGRATPADALETLFRSVWALDYPTLAKMVTFTEKDRARVDAVFTRIPGHVREKMQIASAEDLFALVWAMENSERYASLRAISATPQGADEVEQAFEAQRANLERVDRGQVLFRRGADGWQWVVPELALDRLEADLRQMKVGPLTPEWARKLVVDRSGPQP